MSRHHRRLALAMCVALSAAGFTVTAAGTAEAAKRSVKDLLNSLAVAAEPSYQGHDSFGEYGRSKKAGCRYVSTEVLAADAIGPFPTRCKITNSSWKDPFTGKTVTSYRAMQVDMFVPEKEAYHSGAKDWDDATKTAYHNDLGFDGSLVAVAKKSSKMRGGKEPQTWLPNVKAVRCPYASNWVAVKYRWGLSVDSAEKAALAKALAACGWPKVAVPAKAKVTVWGAPTPTPTPTQTPSPTLDTRYNTCAELAAAGKGPYLRGVDEEYAWYRDDDGDGIACETTESLRIMASNDWQTERYTRSSNPRVIAAVEPIPNPNYMPPFGRTYLHARVLAGDVEVWRGASLSSRTTAGESYVDVYPEQPLPDGAYRVEVWTSEVEDPAETAPPGELTGMSFIVDTQAPGAPTYTGSSRGGTAVSDDAALWRLRFTYGEWQYDHAARPGQPVDWSAPYHSGPPFDLTVRAIDRAGNLGAPVARAG